MPTRKRPFVHLRRAPNPHSQWASDTLRLGSFQWQKHLHSPKRLLTLKVGRHVKVWFRQYEDRSRTFTVELGWLCIQLGGITKVMLGRTGFVKQGVTSLLSWRGRRLFAGDCHIGDIASMYRVAWRDG